MTTIIRINRIKNQINKTFILSNGFRKSGLHCIGNVDKEKQKLIDGHKRLGKAIAGKLKIFDEEVLVFED